MARVAPQYPIATYQALSMVNYHSIPKLNDYIIQSDEYLAREYLKNIGLNENIVDDVINSFDKGTIKLDITKPNDYGIRFYDNKNAFAKGRYLFPSFTNNTNRQGLALLPEWNSMKYLKQWEIEEGHVIIKGKVAL